MDLQNEKCVMVIDENLPLGIIANTAAIMGITLGKEMPEVVGANVTDQSGNEHLNIIEFPVPISKMGNVSESTLQYFNLAICGPEKKTIFNTGKSPEKLFNPIKG